MEVAFAFYEPISSCRLLEAVDDDLVLKVNHEGYVRMGRMGNIFDILRILKST